MVGFKTSKSVLITVYGTRLTQEQSTSECKNEMEEWEEGNRCSFIKAKFHIYQTDLHEAYFQ